MVKYSYRCSHAGCCCGSRAEIPHLLSRGVWHIIIFLYIMVACVVPVWALLQPRDYLNSYLLVFMIAAAVVGIFSS